jgi:NAD(P)-dependent dehydrogenase (short-subunit alcohol dehydrogenase family)
MSTICTLITGASSGIGREIATRLSKNSNLILSGRNAAGLQTTLSQCSDTRTHHLWEFDLENVADIKESLEPFLHENNLRVDTFIHSAGNVKVAHMKNMDYKNSLQIFNINFFSAAEIIALLLKKKINDSHLKNIVLISAVLGEFGARGYNLYGATKAALDGLMRSLAVELAPAIRVNSILPGLIETNMSEGIFKDHNLLERTLSQYPLKNGLPEDIANMVEFLISDKAKWITGQQLVVDGGRSINIS